MQKHEYTKFNELWQICNELSVNGKMVSKPAMDLIFEDLKDYPLAWIDKALAIHRKTNKFAPTVADIIAIIQSKQPKHPSADEAWVKVLEAMDERRTVVFTTAMLAAKCEVDAAWDEKNHTAMRMAFRAVYDRMIASNPPVEWVVSLGDDPNGRAHVVNAAVDAGLLPAAQRILLENQPEKMGNLIAALENQQDKNTLAGQVEKTKLALRSLKSNTFMADNRTENERLNAEISARDEKRLEWKKKVDEHLRLVFARLSEKELQNARN